MNDVGIGYSFVLDPYCLDEKCMGQLPYVILEEISMVINGPMNHEIFYGKLKDNFLV
jgi:hypothetical protein